MSYILIFKATYRGKENIRNIIIKILKTSKELTFLFFKN